MKILHLIYNDKYASSFVNLVNNYFDKHDHLMIFAGGVDEKQIEIPKEGKVIVFKKSLRYFKLILRELYSADRIVMHTLYNKALVLSLFFQPWLLKKTVWVCVGGDLYCHKLRKKSYISFSYDLIKGYVIRRLEGIATLVKGDYELAKQWYRTNSKNYHAIYTSSDRIEYFKKLRSVAGYGSKKNDVTSILVGNSATKTNNHYEILHILSQYKNENMKIYCPLSYGDMKYSKEIKELGFKLFGNKFISIDEFMSKEEYAIFQSEIDIGIFNNDRQQGLGNIFSMILLRKKVYLKNNTTMWNELVNEMNLKIYDINALRECDFNSFIYIDNEAIEQNVVSLDKKYESSNIIDVWNKIFEFKNENINES